MKSDISRLMAERGIDAIVVEGGKECGPLMRYITGGVGLGSAIYVEKKNGEKILVHSLIERDEAKKTGLPCASFSDLGLKALLDEEKSMVRAQARLYEKLLAKLQVKGKVLFLGSADLGRFLPVLEGIKKRIPGIEVVYDDDEGLFDVARRTKSPDEVGKIKMAGEKTSACLAALVDYLSAMKLSAGRVIKKNGAPLMIADMREFMRTEFAKRGLIEVGGSVISQGRDSAVPHSVGKDDDEVVCGKTIVVDIFPKDVSTGYVFDLTRTLHLGPPSREVQEIYDDVFGALKYAKEILKSGRETRVCQDEICEFFEKKGHPTIRQVDSAVEGYTHSIGHGIGLEVHESPGFGGSQANKDRISPGMVFTVEPGLYFPSKEIGVRIEDVFYMREDGSTENLTKVPYDLEIAMKSS